MLAGVNGSEEGRSRILSTASKCVRQYGFQGTSMEMIGKEAGVSLANLRQCYSSLEMIVAALAIDHLETVENDLARLGPDAGPVSILTTLLDRTKEWNENGDALLFFNLLGETERNPSIENILKKSLHYVRTALVASIARGKVRGAIAQEVDANVVAALMSAMSHVSLMMRFLGQEREVEQANQLFVRLMKNIARPETAHTFL